MIHAEFERFSVKNSNFHRDEILDFMRVEDLEVWFEDPTNISVRR